MSTINIIKRSILRTFSKQKKQTKDRKYEHKLRAHMALVTRQEELRAKSSYGMSSNKILRINRMI